MSRRPRVLMVNYEFPPLGGGSANATFHMLREIGRKAGLRVDLVTSGPSDRLETGRIGENVGLFKIPVRKAKRQYWTVRELATWSRHALGFSRRLAAERDYDLCHCWSGWPSGIIGYTLRRKLPYLIALRGSDVPGYSSRLRLLDPLLFRHVSRRIWRSASAVTCVSRSQVALAERTDRSVEFRLIPNGVDTTVFHPGPDPEVFTVLFVGRLIHRKGVDHLIEAFASLGEERGGARLVIVGDGPARNALEDLARRRGVAERVMFRGATNWSGLPEIYREASLFVLPAHEEAMSNAALEAMASGLPIITTDTGVAEILDENGFVVPRSDPGAIADAIRRYLRDPELLRRHGERSRERAEQMSWEGVSRDYLDLYDRILSRPGG
ncbi:MAG: glycosyltransferase family 4 protein [Candidatus Eisenbacteria bacterium]